MKRIIRQLKTYLSWPAETIEADQPAKPLIVKSDDIAENNEPEKHDLMPDIYAEERSATVPIHEVLNQPCSDEEDSAGFNPYDTGVLQNKR